MNDSNEERIEAVLQGLRQVEPDPSMQSQILSALRAEEASETRSASTRRWVTSAVLSAPAVPWLAAAALLLAAGGTLLLHRHVELYSQPEHTASVPVSESFPQPPTNNVSAPMDEPALTRVPHVAQRHGIRPLTTAAPHVSEARPGAPTAKAEDASFPAPPLPLTEQERLLLRLVRDEVPTQLAQLTPPARDANLRQEQDRVTEFFMPPPLIPGQQEPPGYVVQTRQQ